MLSRLYELVRLLDLRVREDMKWLDALDRTFSHELHHISHQASGLLLLFHDQHLKIDQTEANVSKELVHWKRCCIVELPLFDLIHTPTLWDLAVKVAELMYEQFGQASN